MVPEWLLRAPLLVTATGVLEVLGAIGLLLPCQIPAANDESTSSEHIRRVESELVPVGPGPTVELAPAG